MHTVNDMQARETRDLYMLKQVRPGAYKTPQINKLPSLAQHRKCQVSQRRRHMTKQSCPAHEQLYDPDAMLPLQTANAPTASNPAMDKGG
jgi:hypothetical protein